MSISQKSCMFVRNELYNIYPWKRLKELGANVYKYIFDARYRNGVRKKHTQDGHKLLHELVAIIQLLAIDSPGCWVCTHKSSMDVRINKAWTETMKIKK